MRKSAGDIPENRRALIAAIVRKVTGCSLNTLEHITHRGMNNAVTLATTEAGAVVVRTNVATHLFRFQREAWCFKQLKLRGVPVPEVLGCGVEDEHAYSVAKYIEGALVSLSEAKRLHAWQTLGSYAARLNAIDEAAIDEDGKAQEYFPLRWKEQVSADIELIFKDSYWVHAGEMSAAEQSHLEEYLFRTTQVAAPHGICQFDICCENALICDGKDAPIYLIDLEWANVAPVPHYQLACVAASEGGGSELLRCFVRGYGLTERELEDISGELERFVLLRLMRATAWARDRFPQLLEENLERTRPMLRQILQELTSQG